MIESLIEPRAPRTQSRIHGCRRVLAELRRLRVKVDRAAAYRAITQAEKVWTARVGDSLEALISEGSIVLPGGEDPRPGRRARKRQPRLL